MQLAVTSLAEPASAEEAVMMTMVSVGRRMRQRLPGEELDFSALPLLKALASTGPLRLSVLADRLRLDASTVSRQVRHLEERGFLTRTADPDDRRASRVALTEHGRHRLEHGAARRRELLARALAGWSDEERDRLRELLVRLHTDLDATPDAQETAS